MKYASKPESAGTAATTGPTKQMWRRSIVVFIILVAMGFTYITGKLVNIQFVQADKLSREAETQQMRDMTTSPKRGAIYDTNMTILAQSSNVWTVVMSPKDIKNDEIRALIADELSVMLDLDRDKLYERTKKTYSQYEEIKKKIERPLALELNKWISEHNLAGVLRTIDDYKRYYPSNNLLSGVIGFTGTDNTGLYGLEAYYNETLAGKAGRVITAKNGAGDPLNAKMKYEKNIGAEDGKSLVLTIDSVVQYYAEKYLEIAIKETACSNRGAIIIMDVRTGAIIAMATKGDYDPNSPMEITDPTLETMLAALSGDEYSAALKAAREEQWVNKPISDFYEPGSVFKTVTSAAALEEKKVTRNTTFFCNGVLSVGGHGIHCHRTNGHGSQTFPEALSNSCNPAFMKIGEALGRNLFFKYYTAFGFTETTGIDMLSESRVTPALYHNESSLNETELAVAAFGQRNKVTPIQMITAMAAVANGGNLLRPYVVEKVLNPDQSVFSVTETKVKRQIISEQVSKDLSLMLGDVVTSGGAMNAYIPGYRMAGKTGTSEKLDTLPKGNVVASFSGFAPYDDPQYAILVMLDEPQVNTRFGGLLAAPVAQKVLSEALPYLGIEPQYTEAERANLERTTPNVLGKNTSAAQVMLANADLKYDLIGDGDTVLKQVPAGGQTIPKNGRVALYTTEGMLPTTTRVPDFSGKTLSQANALAADYHLNLQITGQGLESGEASASSQSIEKDQQVPWGTVVKVTFVHKDSIA